MCAPSPPVPTMSTLGRGEAHRRRDLEHGRRPGRPPPRATRPWPAARRRSRRSATGVASPGHHLAHRPGGVGGGEVLRGPAAGSAGPARSGRRGGPRRGAHPRLTGGRRDGAPARAAAPPRRPGRRGGRPGTAGSPSARDQWASHRSACRAMSTHTAGRSWTSWSICRASASPPVGCASPSRMHRSMPPRSTAAMTSSPVEHSIHVSGADVRGGTAADRRPHGLADLGSVAVDQHAGRCGGGRGVAHAVDPSGTAPGFPGMAGATVKS